MPKLLQARPALDAREARQVQKLATSMHAPADWIFHAKMILRSWGGQRTSAIARALHVLSIVLWIGGVGFVTTVLMPSVRRLKAPHERIGFFDAVERRFAWQARIWTLLVGLTGLYLLSRLDFWDRFRYAAYWWMHAMIAVWLLFTVVLFVAEPLFLHRWLLARAKAKPEATFRLLEWLHWVWLILSLVTVAGAVAGTHGLLLFE